MVPKTAHIVETYYDLIALPTIKETENTSSTYALRFPFGNDEYLLNVKDSYLQKHSSAIRFWSRVLRDSRNLKYLLDNNEL